MLNFRFDVTCAQRDDNLQSYAVIILDYISPDFKSTEACQHLQKINYDQEFLFASEHFDFKYLKDQLETGAAGF